MGSRLKVLTVIGTRPEAIKLFPLIHALEASDCFESRVCVTGQHREMLDTVLELADIQPHHDCAVMQPGQSLESLSSRLLGALSGVLIAERPDIVIVQGDTTTAFIAALAAHYRRIPVAHVEAGLRSGDLENPWPEEFNRKAIGSLARWHFAPTHRARDALLAENVPPNFIHVTGNTGIDAMMWMSVRLANEPALAARMRSIEQMCAGKRIIGVTCHRRENLGIGVKGIAAALAGLATRGDVALVIPLHPNPQASRPLVERLEGLPDVHLVEPLDYPDFVRLLQASHFMLSDSGGVQEEAPAVGTPVLVMRETTERPEAIESGNAMLVGANPMRILRAANELLDDPVRRRAMACAVSPYGDGLAAGRILGLLPAHNREDQKGASIKNSS